MKNIVYTLCMISLCLIPASLHAQDIPTDCDIYLDELELQLKKDMKDTDKYFHIQLEEGNEIFKRDLAKLSSKREKKELRKEYKDFVRNLEKDYNKELDKLEDDFLDVMEDAADDCGSTRVRRKLAAVMGDDYFYRSRRW
ncbi:MAG: hypothetical protein R8P61_21770 [Bacteroidia bacterium]|nr:hypothetical protein [Bacteroidia bacterium]